MGDSGYGGTRGEFLVHILREQKCGYSDDPMEDDVIVVDVLVSKICNEILVGVDQILVGALPSPTEICLWSI